MLADRVAGSGVAQEELQVKKTMFGAIGSGAKKRRLADPHLSRFWDYCPLQSLLVFVLVEFGGHMIIGDLFTEQVEGINSVRIAIPCKPDVT